MHVRIESGGESVKHQTACNEQDGGCHPNILEQKSGQRHTRRPTTEDNKPIDTIDTTLQGPRIAQRDCVRAYR
jgi:hypothetical protein